MNFPETYYEVEIVVNDTQSDSIQYLNFAKKWLIQYSIQYCFTQDSIQNIIQYKKICWFNSKDNSIHLPGNHWYWKIYFTNYTLCTALVSSTLIFGYMWISVCFLRCRCLIIFAGYHGPNAIIWMMITYISSDI